MEEIQVESLKKSTFSMLKGNYPVLKMMGDRIRQLFRVALACSEDREKFPSSIRSGASNNLGRNDNAKISKKVKFMVELSKVAENLVLVFLVKNFSKKLVMKKNSLNISLRSMESKFLIR